ncbi:Rv2578c family radical SAM protein [Saccharopolyspora sp. HNM0983]|uniref:Rv2578c family radical SAM protein n=1 Tax=Saccharopolyspora montiporae TaxID=2781240 RepID=A0A929FYH3_9PSEU|nr:Rv2578c family radical SAM protein [Saccharopolyspora sp. HNM0983]MBE9373389.1 Rv2578c family radical SAM protein [Saccharopolyspora sp. HNM0983]
MRWEQQRVAPPAAAAELPLDLPEPQVARGGGRGGLRLPDPVPIESGTEDAYAIEIRAKSIINRVPGESHVPFAHTVNPYRGCGHACRYCFARGTHTYLDLDAGHDFDSKIVVKVNAAELLRRELAHPRWRGDPIAMGTNTDPYQRAEGRYRLMRGILGALRDRANPFSVLTKGTLILRDLDLFQQAAQRCEVSVAVSIGSVDEQLWREVEPGTPSPLRRLDVVRQFVEVGIGCSVLMAPVLPGLSDSAEQIDETVAALTEAGATGITPIVLHLRPGAREWYRKWLTETRPDLLDLYSRLYRDRSYAPQSYQREVLAAVAEAQQRHHERHPDPGGEFRAVGPQPPAESTSEAAQLSLL